MAMVTNVYLNNLPFHFSINSFYESNYLTGIVAAFEKSTQAYDQPTSLFFYLNTGSFDKIVSAIPISEGIKICIIIDENLKEQPTLLQHFDVVFQAYLSSIHCPKRYFHFPLGTGNNFFEQSVTPIHLREHNAFFSGNLHNGRCDFYKEISGLRLLPFSVLHRLERLLFGGVHDDYYKNSFIRFSDGFTKGLDAEQYSNLLYRSKVVLCPEGISNIESYRFYEAIKAGCIVVTTKIPNKPFYMNAPVFQISTWKELLMVLNEILRSEFEQLKIQQQVIKYWENELSEKAIADYLTDFTFRSISATSLCG